MPITSRQRRNIQEFILEERQRYGTPDDEIFRALVQNGAPVAEARSAFLELGGALRGTDIPERRDVGLIPGTFQVGGAALKDATLGPVAGILERLGMVDEGTRQGIRQDFETAREDFLASDPGPLRTTISGLAEFGANVVPITPAGPAGRAVAKGLGLTGRGARAVAGGVAGLAEGGVVAAGDAPLVAPEDRKKVGFIQTVGAAALGSSAALRTTGHIVTDPSTKAFQQRFFRRTAKKHPRQSIADRTRDLHTQWVNALGPVERVGKRVGRTEEFAIAAQRVRVAQSLSRSPVYSVTRDLSGRKTGEGFMTIMDDARAAADTLKLSDEELLQDAAHYMVSQRQVELSGRPKIDTSKADTEIAKKRLADLAQKYGTDEAGETLFLSEFSGRLRDWSVRAHLDPLVEVGVLSRKEYARILDDNQLFAPYQRAMDELAESGADLSFGGAPLKGKLISEGLSPEPGKRLEDIYGVMADRAMRVQMFTQQQRLRNLVAEAASADASIAKEIRPRTELVSIRLDPVEARRLGKETVHRRRPAKGEKVFDVYKDGKRQSWTAPDDVLKALDLLNSGEFKHFQRWYGKLARISTQTFRAGATLSVEFGIRNVLRDPWTLGIYSRNGAIPFLSSARAFTESLFNIRGGRELWQEFVDSPAAHATFLSPDRWNLARELRIAQDVARKGPVSRAVGATIRNPLLPLQKLSDGLEKFSRFAEFARARRRGRTINQAGLDAADVTLNFPRLGTVSKTWNMVEAFSGAAINDVSKFMRSMSERPFATTLKGFAYLTAPTMAAHVAFKDDPDYQNRDEWANVLTLPVYKLDNRRFISLPKPPGILNLVFSYLPQKAVEFMEAKAREAGDARTQEIINEALQGITEQTPLGYVPLVGSAGGKPVGDPFINLMPNALQPMIELAANRVPFFDKPVVGQSLERLPATERVTEFTSSPARALGRTGVGQDLGGPAAIDHLIRGYLGTLGRVAAEELSPGRDEALLRRSLPAWAKDIPGLRNALRALTGPSPVGFGSKPVRRFYDLAQAVAQHEAAARKQQGIEAQERYKNGHPEARFGKEVRFYKKEIDFWSDQRQAIVESKKIDALQKDEYLLQIDSQITLLADAAVQQIEAGIENDLRTILSKDPTED